jgi:F-type H+-transporting ATPase subunit gamma
MAGSQRIYRQRIKSTQSLKKIFRAMELIAASRIGRARDRAVHAAPYARMLTRALSAVATHATVDHPLTRPRTDTNKVAVLAVTADRGMAGAYTASVLRETERLIAKLEEQGKEAQIFVTGRRGLGYFTFRQRPVAHGWVGESDAPRVETAHEIADRLLAAFQAPAAEGGVSELHIVYTRFQSMVTQTPRILRMIPLEVVEGVEVPEEEEALPLYEFEPSEDAVLDDLLPLYIRSRIYAALLQAAASELASRQRAMHTAVENADDLIRMYTRMANAARQAEITQEISEIVSGADALASS